MNGKVIPLVKKEPFCPCHPSASHPGFSSAPATLPALCVELRRLPACLRRLRPRLRVARVIWPERHPVSSVSSAFIRCHRLFVADWSRIFLCCASPESGFVRRPGPAVWGQDQADLATMVGLFRLWNFPGSCRPVHTPGRAARAGGPPTIRGGYSIHEHQPASQVY